MKLFDFDKRFPTEQSCRTYLKTVRLKQGVTCSQCNCKTKHYWIESVEKFKCAICGSRTNLKAGTVMEKSKMSILTWFKVIHLMTSTKKSLSALEVQKQVSHLRYEPIWYMMNKIRKSMGKRDDRYKLNGVVEMDDAFFQVVNLSEPYTYEDEAIEEGLKRGRGSQKKQKVLIMVESKPVINQKDPHKKKRAMGFLKMVTMDELNNVGINYETQKGLEADSSVISDNYRGYSKLKDVVKVHVPKTVPQKEAHIVLPWVHTVIANCKRQLLGVHHSVGKEYLQNYLDEFCYKTNRRNFESDLFDRMISTGADDVWY
ncbi:MAG: IS1595 family transposase [Bacteroidetes bacterium]|nr:IS1595 family transposase [Bacteroidota bacterium]